MGDLWRLSRQVFGSVNDQPQMAIAIGGPMEQPGFKIARLGPMRPIGEEFWARLPSSQRAGYNVILAQGMQISLKQPNNRPMYWASSGRCFPHTGRTRSTIDPG